MVTLRRPRLVVVAGCLRSTSFPCASDPECGTGTCESVGFCSFVDATCMGGSRFGEHAGPYAGQCVVDPTADAGVDATDAPLDAPAGCPSDYITVTGGQAGHRYKPRAGNASWQVHRDACAGEGAYLAIPGAASELQALDALVSGGFFVGISDQATENTWLDVLGAPATFLPWSGGQPDDDSPGEDCVRSFGTSYSDERCSRTAAAVCECLD